ncbi:hypothetical protein [Viscerimonas tarda]
MARIAGVKYDSDVMGNKTHLHIDLRKAAKCGVVEDFVDYLDVLASDEEDSISGQEFEREQNAKRGIGV